MDIPMVVACSKSAGLTDVSSGESVRTEPVWSSDAVLPGNTLQTGGTKLSWSWPEVVTTGPNCDSWQGKSRPQIIHIMGPDACTTESATFRWRDDLQFAERLNFSFDMMLNKGMSVDQWESNDMSDISGVSGRAREEVNNRLNELRDIAAEEGLELSPESGKDLWQFLQSVPMTRRPCISLLDNGNFRVVWKNANLEQVGIQFRGGKQVQYVFFSLRSPDGFMVRSFGRDTLQNIQRQIDALDLGRLMTT